jgi:DNA mismatch repair ATPase MutL
MAHISELADLLSSSVSAMSRSISANAGGGLRPSASARPSQPGFMGNQLPYSVSLNPAQQSSPAQTTSTLPNNPADIGQSPIPTPNPQIENPNSAGRANEAPQSPEAPKESPAPETSENKAAGSNREETKEEKEEEFEESLYAAEEKPEETKETNEVTEEKLEKKATSEIKEEATESHPHPKNQKIGQNNQRLVVLNVDDFGKMKVVELIENGRNVDVTNGNKMEYVRLFTYAKMANEIKEQIESFLQGLHELVPQELLSIFDHRELELMISGLPEIDRTFFSFIVKNEKQLTI